jgi:hypothetical protein
MEPKAELNMREHARELFIRHQARYEVSPYFVLLDVRTFGMPPSYRRIHAGYDVDLYGNGFEHGSALSFANGEPRKTWNELCAACQVVVEREAEYSSIEIIPDDATLVLNVKSHLEPEARVRIRITHKGGLDQPAGAGEDKARAEVEKSLDSLGVKRN